MTTIPRWTWEAVGAVLLCVALARGCSLSSEVDALHRARAADAAALDALDRARQVEAERRAVADAQLVTALDAMDDARRAADDALARARAELADVDARIVRAATESDRAVADEVNRAWGEP